MNITRRKFSTATGWFLASVLALFLTVGPGASGARADTKDDVLKRMKDRVPALLEQKKAGKVGEVWNGTVDAVKAEYLQDAKIAGLVKDENADRAKLFEIIGKEQGSTAAVAGEAFGKTAFDRAAKGEWLKYKDGAWKQKS